MTTIDKLMILAGGDVDRLRRAIARAASGEKSARLEDVVANLVRPSPRAIPAPRSALPS